MSKAFTTEGIPQILRQIAAEGIETDRLDLYDPNIIAGAFHTEGGSTYLLESPSDNPDAKLGPASWMLTSRFNEHFPASLTGDPTDALVRVPTMLAGGGRFITKSDRPLITEVMLTPDGNSADHTRRSGRTIGVTLPIRIVYLDKI